MNVSVLVPIAGDRSRIEVWRWLRRHYWERHYPDWQVCVGTDASPDFSKGVAVAHAYRDAWHDVLIIADADALIFPEFVRAAVDDVGDGAPWVVPFSVVHRLRSDATGRVFRHDITTEAELAGGIYRTDSVVVPGGGMVVLSRAAYETVGGIDPRFTVWGGEVDAFGWALGALCGEYGQEPGRLWHLWHRPGRRRQHVPPLNECLAGSYRQAYEARDVDRMRRLCAREEACR